MNRRIHSVIVSAAVLLTACSSTPVVAPVDTAAREAQAERAVAQGDLATAREIYAQLLRRSTGDERNRLQIGLARAEVEFDNPDAALAALAAVTPPLTPALESELWAVRAAALFALGQPVEAVQLLVEREIWLDSSATILANQNLIWDGLALPLSQAAADTRTGDNTVDGWLALAPLTRLTNNDADFLAALIVWREEFSNHQAAAGILAERVAALRGVRQQPGRIALLLPLSTALRAEARAILYGFHAAHFASGQVDTTAIEVLDTGLRGSVESYQSALLQGVDFIVGPLRQTEVEQVQTQAGIVPTLALNFSASPSPAGPNFFQFALSSDDEIEAIATRAIASGHRSAAILHARNPRGRRLAEGFRLAFESRGGSIVDTRDYLEGSTNLVDPIKALLNVSSSEARYNQLRNFLGADLVFEPRRRADIDMIFLQADPVYGPADARLLVPLLETYGAADIPTYTTPDVYIPARVVNEPDLDGLIFPDQPLLVNPAGGARSAAEMLAELGDGAGQYQRYFALGFDAYALVQALYSQNAAIWPLAGATGDIYLGDNGRLRRVLPFAEFRDGRPQAAGPAIGLFGSR